MMAAQDDARAKRDHADFVIDNVGSLDALERRVDDVWRELQRLAAGARDRPG